ncbi:MAG: hypothetical protein ACRD1V_12040, partial [Vicinamibacterales bacterium]
MSAIRRVLWRDPGAIASRDLSWSNIAKFPRPSAPFTFVKEDMSGSHPKVRVQDAEGREWTAKLEGDAHATGEAHAEVAAARLVWALGYYVQPSYFVDGGVIEHVTHMHRASALTSEGRFPGAGFKERSPDLETTRRHWSIEKNPFVGTRELSGLMILMTMISNWDLNARNLEILRARNPDGTTELRYVVTDLGASFGHLEDGRFPHSLLSMYPWTMWNLHDYQKQRFVEGVKEGRLQLHFRGNAGFRTVPLEHARWFASLVSQLTPTQVRAAFEAADATPQDVDG